MVRMKPVTYLPGSYQGGVCSWDGYLRNTPLNPL